MQSCNQITADLKAFVDGELSTTQKAAVERHVNECPDCRQELDDIKRISSHLRELDTAVPRPELRSRILSQIVPAEQPVLRRPKSPFWRNWISGLTLAGAAAAAVVLFAYTRKAPPTSTLEDLRDTEQKSVSSHEEPVLKSGAGAPSNAGAMGKQPLTGATGRINTPAPKSDNESAGVRRPNSQATPKVAEPRTENFAAALPTNSADRLAPAVRGESGSLPSTPTIAQKSPSGPRSDSTLALKPGITDLPSVDEKKSSAADTSRSMKLAAPAVIQLGLSVQQQPTVDIVVDRLESGVERVNSAAKAEGGQVEKTLSSDNGASQALFFVTVPAKNFDAFKNRLNVKDGNTLYTHFAETESLKSDSSLSAGGALGRAQAPANYNFGYQKEARGQKTEGIPQGGGRGGGGFGGGGAQQSQQNAGKAMQQLDGYGRDTNNRNIAANNQNMRAKGSEQRGVNLKGQLNAPESQALAKEQFKKRVVEAPYGRQNTAQPQVQGKGAPRSGGYGEEKLGYKDKANLSANSLEENDKGTVRFLVRLREPAKPAGATKQP